MPPSSLDLPVTIIGVRGQIAEVHPNAVDEDYDNEELGSASADAALIAAAPDLYEQAAKFVEEMEALNGSGADADQAIPVAVRAVRALQPILKKVRGES